MQKLKQYLREVIIGGIYLIFPLTLLIYVASMAHDFVAILIRPLSNVMPDIIPGFDGSYLLAAFILIQLCFLGGILLLNKNNRCRRLVVHANKAQQQQSFCPAADVK